MKPQEGQVTDLAKGVEAGTMTAEQAISSLKERKLTEKDIFRYSFWAYLIWIIPVFLPWFLGNWKLPFLDFLTNLPRIVFPPIVAYIALAFFVAAIPLTAWGMYSNSKYGGCKTEDHTVHLLRKGPYAIIRHPSHLAWSVFFVTTPIFLSQYVPFTVLSAIGIIGIVIFHYYASIKEERDLDIKKWGDAYRRYMEEVPRWNIITGLVRMARRK